jgi:pyoverdine/dityrosine biosynthesis protein Dit1
MTEYIMSDTRIFPNCILSDVNNNSSFNQHLRSMPRPPSELTKFHIQISVRVTDVQKEEFQRMGGATWLRQQIANAMKQRQKREAEFEKQK